MIPKKVIYCRLSGLPLAEVTALCSQGWPLLSSFSRILVHPIYSTPLDKLLVRLSSQLLALESREYKAESDTEKQELCLTESAIMHSLDAMWKPPHWEHWEALERFDKYQPTLPSFPIAVGCGARLLHLASWYHHLSSKRLPLPTFHPASATRNEHWENFSAYLDAAFSVKEEWDKGRDRLVTEEQQKRTADASKEIKSVNIYKRIDFNKVWNWIDAQITQSPKYPAGRRETLKTLFMRGDLDPENWVSDDIDDLAEAVFDLCDQGNEITHFIRQRLNHIRSSINSFYGSFTLLSPASLNSSKSGANEVGANALPADAPTQQETEFFESFDSRLANMTELPAAPKRQDFTSLGLFLKAQAQHNILTRRWALLQSKQPKPV
jgi:hypothetical protein